MSPEDEKRARMYLVFIVAVALVGIGAGVALYLVNLNNLNIPIWFLIIAFPVAGFFLAFQYSVWRARFIRERSKPVRKGQRR